MACVDNGYVQPAPFVNTNAVADGLGSDCEHGWVVADKDDSASGRHCRLEDADNVGNGQTGEERPHAEVLETGWRGRELIAQSIVFHVYADEVIESWCRKAEDA